MSDLRIPPLPPCPSRSPNLHQVSIGPGIALRCVGHAPTRRSVLPPLGGLDDSNPNPNLILTLVLTLTLT